MYNLLEIKYVNLNSGCCDLIFKAELPQGISLCGYQMNYYRAATSALLELKLDGKLHKWQPQSKTRTKVIFHNQIWEISRFIS